MSTAAQDEQNLHDAYCEWTDRTAMEFAKAIVAQNPSLEPDFIANKAYAMTAAMGQAHDTYHIGLSKIRFNSERFIHAMSETQVPQ